MENKTRLHIILACFAGAFLGALLGLELAAYSRFLWIPSALVGGLVAYLTYNLREVGAATRRAWISAVDWQPDIPSWKATARWVINKLTTVAYLALLAETWVIAIAAIGLFPPFITMGYNFVVIGLSWVFLTLLAYVTFEVHWPGEKDNDVRRFCLLYSSIGLPFFAASGCLRIVYECICGVWLAAYQLIKYRREIMRGIWAAVRAVGRFIARVFKLIHSDVRTICFVDATIGATIGYFVGSALLGGLLGAAAGLFNYEVVSIRWLKLAPAHARR